MLEWANINNLKILSDEIGLSGFKKFGCLGSYDLINFDKTLKFNMKFKYSDNPINNAAIIDVDFKHSAEYHSFASLVYQNENLITYIRNNGFELKIWEGCPIEDKDWHNLDLLLNEKSVSFYIDNNLITSYEFDDKISPCMIFIGGNSTKNLESHREESISLYVKDISIIADDISVSLIKENLVLLEDNND